MTPQSRQNRAEDRTEAAPRRTRGPVESSFLRASKLTAPAAVAAATAALISVDQTSGLWLTVGVGAGAALGAAVAALFDAQRRFEEAGPETPLSRIELIGEAAQDAAELLAGPAASLSEAVNDALRILERLPVALLLLDEKGRIAFSNAAAEVQLGRAARGEHFSSALRAPALAEAIREVYAGRPIAEVDFAQRRFQERLIHATVRALTAQDAAAQDDRPDDDEADALDAEASSPAPSSSPSSPAAAAPMLGHARVVVLLQDHTGIRRAEQLHRDFVANASHELKTPIAAIAGFAETLRGAAKDDAEARERFLRIMQQQAERMRRLVEDLLSLNRIELNEHVPPRDVLNLAALLRETAQQSPEFEMGRIDIEIAAEADQRQVRGDQAQLEQVFINLIENALKYGGESAPIRLSISERASPRRQIGATVEDFGPGIPKEHVRRLTERFYRVEGKKGGLRSGTGLGLSIVKHAVSRHRGELEIDSRLGHGSRFTVWLPLAEEFDAAPIDA